MKQNGAKYLVDLVSGLSHKEFFFIFWAALVGCFLLMFWNYHRKMTRRNFKGPEKSKAGGLKPLQPLNQLRKPNNRKP